MYSPPKNYEKCIRIASLFIAILGMAVVAGWMFNIPLLKSLIPGYVSMKFNTALSFILLAITLFLHTSKSNFIYRKLIILFPLIVFLVGMISFLEELFHFDLELSLMHIGDSMLYPINQSYPGRISPITAFCLILMSWVHLTIKSKITTFQMINQFLLHICTLTAFIVILGYLLNTPQFYRFTFLTSMALYSAIITFLLSITASLVNPSLGVTGLFTGNAVGNLLAKKLFLQMVISIVILGYMRFLLHIHYKINAQFGIALYTLSFILISFFLIWRTTRALNAIELKKRDAEENLFSISMFLDLTPDPIIIVDEKGAIQIANNQTETIFGYTKDELIGKKIELLMPDQFEKIHEHHRAEYFSHPRIRNMATGLDLYAKRKDGSEFPVEISLSPIKTDTGMMVSAAIRDITLRKEEERKISQLAAIIETSGDAIISKALDSTILTWNKGAEKILGYTYEEVVGKPIAFLFPPELLAEEKSIINRIVNGEYIDQYETVRIRKDQTRINVSITTSPIKDKNGKVIAVSKILRDVTKNKEEEEKLRKYAILESKSKEMEQFAYVASHDLREPLLTIKNYMKLFLKNYGEAVDEESKQYIQAVVKAADRMDILIRSILDYSRLSQLKELEAVDTLELIKEVEADLNSLISETNAKIVKSGLPIIKAYPVELKLLFQNLIANAIKFRKKESVPEIYISAAKIRSAWYFEVKDNGIGIAEENREKVFHMFKRLHNKNEYEGTGIGLAYCKKIVELHNGTITIESQVGIGSTFKFTILT
jgi:PAS domain S-box-containing protein